MTVKMRVKPSSTLMANLSKVAKTIPEAVVIGMVALAEVIMLDAVERVPVDTGRLRQAGYVAPPSSVTGTVEMGFGTDYAIPVHERTEVRHTTGEAKFLEKAIIAKGQGQLHIVAKAAQGYLGIGGKAQPSKFPTKPREK